MGRALAALAVLAVAVAAAAAVLPVGGTAAPPPKARGCPLFPRSFSTNQRVDRLPVARDSAGSWRRSARRGAAPRLRLRDVRGRADRDPLRRRGPPHGARAGRFGYAGRVRPRRLPDPARRPHRGRPDAVGDRHALLLDRDRCRLFELFELRGAAGRLDRRIRRHAGTCARRGCARRAGRRADAAGLPILPLLARYDEVRRGRIDHALRVTVRRSRSAYVYPARHFASDSDDPSLPRMGERLRLKAGVDVSGLPRQARVVAAGAADATA